MNVNVLPVTSEALEARADEMVLDLRHKEKTQEEGREYDKTRASPKLMARDAGFTVLWFLTAFHGAAYVRSRRKPGVTTAEASPSVQASLMDREI